MEEPRRLTTRIAVVVAVLLVAACERAPSSRARVTFDECRLPKLSAAARCATVEVPENRDDPNGRRIGIFVAVLPATTLTPNSDPLVILAGGPGQSATSLAPFASRLLEVRRTRDVILVDQRGTGRSAPLRCAAFRFDDDPAQALDSDPLPRARACLEELRTAGVDVTQYTTAAWVADLEAVREALGVERWNLWGGSYGTRAALEYVRRHGDRVRAMVLDGVAPPSLRISHAVWVSRERALEEVIAACKASAACAKAHPELPGVLDRLAESLGPDGRDVTLVDPRTGAPQTVRLTLDGVLVGLHPLTYVPELASLIPEILDRAASGDFAPLAAAAQLVTGELADQMNVALHYAVTCAEDTPRITPQDRETLARLRARRLAEKVFAVCEAWPDARVPADAATPVTSDVPTLMLSGALDPVTPPAYAGEVARTLSRSTEVVAAGYGHIVSMHACAPRLIAAFVDRPEAPLRKPCVEHFATSARPPLWPDHLAPTP